jgi:hypothetical protein
MDRNRKEGWKGEREKEQWNLLSTKVSPLKSINRA